jgi:DNA-binding NarL/FixJ family response regulator
MKTINVFTLDCDSFFSNALIEIIVKFARIGQVRTFSSFQNLCDNVFLTIPDILIIDLEIDDRSKVYKKLHEYFPELKILVVSSYGHHTLISQALQHGVHGYLTKGVSVEELEQAIYAIVDQGFYRNSKTLMSIQNSKMFKTLKKEIRPILSDTELITMKYMVAGLTLDEIYEIRKIPKAILRDHNVHIIRETGMPGTYSLLRYVMEKRIQMKNEDDELSMIQ